MTFKSDVIEYVIVSTYNFTGGDTMKKINELYTRIERPIKVVQFGEGNFLRAFVDYMIDVANEKGVFNGDVAIVKPIPFGSLNRFHEQNNLYTVSMRGKMNGKKYEENRVVTSVQKVVDSGEEYGDFMALSHLDSLRFVVSNTTEAGIVYDPEDRFEAEPPKSYPGKLTKFLYERFRHFNGAADKGLILLPVELIENNGGKLKECVLKLADQWKLGAEFTAWVKENNIFCSTLVDRIVTGYPKAEAEKLWEQLGYEDDLLDTCEPFALWVIESEKDISAEFPLDKAGMHVVFTKDQRPFRERKVRILNGAHTATVLASYLMGKNIVLDCMEDSLIRSYMDTIVMREIVPTVKLPREEAVAFANSVFERYENPFVKHELLSIALNSVSKWKARILPTFRDVYQATGKIPRLLTFSFAALAAFYTSDNLKDGMLEGTRDGQPYPIRDDKAVLDFFAANSKSLPTREFAQLLAGKKEFWGEDLNQYKDFTDTVAKDLERLKKDPISAMASVMDEIKE